MRGKFTDKTYAKMKDCIMQHNMLLPGETVIACVSGGCDSVALLVLLNKLLREDGQSGKLVCAHFDHMLRGEESDGDRAFVKQLCENLNVEFRSERQDAALYSEKHGLSLEAGAREIRYGFFEKLAEEYKGKIAVAHNLNDRVETVILNIARGTGIHGLKGISYTRDNIIRPLLDISREELEQVLSENGIGFRTDSTNNETFCRRNKIRLDILPYLRENLAEDIDNKLMRLSQLATEDNEYLESVAKEYFTSMVKCDSGLVTINNRCFNELHGAIRSRVAILILREFYPGGVGITATAVKELEKALESDGAGYSGEVGKGLFVRVYHDRVVVRKGSSECQDAVRGVIEYCETTPEDALGAGRKEDRMWAAFDKDALDAYCKEKGAAWEIRCRREGDYFTPMGSKGGKTLKKFFIDNKVPADQRNTLPLLACGNEILWIPMVRRSNVAPVDKNTVGAILFRYYN